MNEVPVTLSVNGQTYAVRVSPRKLLADVIREDIGLTGTHVGCEHGVCGACTVWVDDRPTRSCLMFAIQAEGHAVTTIEALAQHGQLNVLQQALHEEHGLQCGFCTPGIVMTMEAYLHEHPNPTVDDIRDALSGNLCRCTGYQNIVAGVQKAAQVLAQNSSGATSAAGSGNTHLSEGGREYV